MIIQPRKRTGEYNIEVEQENTSYRKQPAKKTGESNLDNLDREQVNPS